MVATIIQASLLFEIEVSPKAKDEADKTAISFDILVKILSANPNFVISSIGPIFRPSILNP